MPNFALAEGRGIPPGGSLSLTFVFPHSGAVLVEASAWVAKDSEMLVTGVDNKLLAKMYSANDDVAELYTKIRYTGAFGAKGIVNIHITGAYVGFPSLRITDVLKPVLPRLTAWSE